MRHIMLAPSLHILEFAYRPSWSMDDAIATTLHLAVT